MATQTFDIPDSWLQPQWSVPSSVIAFVTSRIQGVSAAPYDSFNLGLHVGDEPGAVLENRRRLGEILPEGLSLQWLEQVHGTNVVDAQADGLTRCGDAVYIDKPGQGGAIMTADCLPVFFASKSGERVALAHAGWRGLVDGVLENTLSRFPDAPEDISIFLGPAIGPCHFEVGVDVREAVLDAATSPTLANSIKEQVFRPGPTEHKYFADLYKLADLRLRAQGALLITGGDQCTFCDRHQFFSYRRDGQTGRFASIIALCP